jgi:dihydroorotate dehydrogenase subfamily 2
MLAVGLQQLIYQHVFKPVVFRFDPESVHDQITKVGAWMGRHGTFKSLARVLWHYEHPMLRQTVCGICFQNPIGLTAGFDKDAKLVDILPDVGFGFMEVGSVTGKPCEGNAKPRLWRLPKSEALLVYYGLKNDGCEVVSERLKGIRQRIPLGVSIAKTNSLDTREVEKGIEDYCRAMRAFLPIADYLTLNISCPNAYGGEPFTRSELLEQLLCATDLLGHTQPVFLKMPSDISFKQADELTEVALRHKVDGLIFSNLTKRRDRDGTHPMEHFPSEHGGISGRPVRELSNQLIKHLFDSVRDRFVLIGVGGIFSAQDAYEKVLSGASLVQLATGMIFRGPQLIGQINKGLVDLLKRDGFHSIREAVGAQR